MAKRILFVDDDPRVRDGLKRLLRRMRDEWVLTFVDSGEEALVALEENAFDVLVTDIRMPGMDGTQLLLRVQELHPHVVRIVLSGHAEMELAMRALPVAHQYLSKPCKAEVLQQVIERACSLNEFLADEKLKVALGKIESLPSIPETYLALNRKLADPDSSARDVAEIVEKDVALSARIFQLSNSSLFGARKRVTSIETAVAYIGINMLKDVVLSFELYRDAQESMNGFCPDELQRHSFLTARIAGQLVEDASLHDDACAAAMLHDIGKLVIGTKLPEAHREIMSLVSTTGSRRREVEVQVLGTTHAEIGAYLLGLWGLPYRVVEAVAHHHDPMRVDIVEFDVLATVAVADHLAGLARHRAAPDEVACPPLPADFAEAIDAPSREGRWLEVLDTITSPLEKSSP